MREKDYSFYNILYEYAMIDIENLFNKEETIDIEYEEVKPKQLEENNEKRSN